MNQTATIRAVFTESGTSHAGKDWTRWDIKAGDSKFQTFDAKLGKKAEALKGQSVELEYEEEQRGQYTNNVLKGITETAPVNAESASSAPAPTASTGSQDEFRRSKEEMRRTEAVKAAATIIGSPNWQGDTDIATLGILADEIVDLIANGSGVPY